jgi:hypothetical protein
MCNRQRVLEYSILRIGSISRSPKYFRSPSEFCIIIICQNIITASTINHMNTLQ